MGNRSVLAQQMNWCNHFTGIQHDACEAGVSYASVRDESGKGPFKFPCLKSDKVTHLCPLAVFPTREEAQAVVDEHEKCVAELLEIIAKGGLEDGCNPVQLSGGATAFVCKGSRDGD